MFFRAVPLLLLATSCSPSRFGSDLHEHPARCDMPAYTWLDDPTLGDVLEREPIRAYEPADIAKLLDSLKDTGQAVVDRRPQYRAFLDRFRYVTQDKGALTEATGMYAWPIGDGPFPILIVTHGTTGYSDACAPSRIAMDDPLAPDALIAGALATFGYVVVSTDYLGMKSMGAPSTERHPYIVGEPTAIASLDAGRAAYKLAHDDKVALGDLFIVGASQGGHAAAMTARYQPHYATDLHPTAGLYLIPPLNLLGHLRRVREPGVDPVTLGNAGAVAMGHASWFGSPGGLGKILKPHWAQAIDDATRTSCALPEIDAPIADVFTPEALSALADDSFDLEPWGCMLRESSLVEMTVPQLDVLPALVVTGEVDPLVDAAVEREGTQKLCAEGMQIEFVECAGKDHGGAVEASINQIFSFIDDRTAQKPLEGFCANAPTRICASDPRAYN